MNSAVCTLFEGDYHYGVGALVNSLYNNGYRGIVWAGYRGKLPPWAVGLKDCADYHDFNVTEGCVVRFVPIETRIHFTNYKPTFMLDLWERCPHIENLFYFDPDIVIKCRWSFFDEWIERGVCLCEEPERHIPARHPIRRAWQEYAEKKKYQVHRELDQYFNGGFVGFSKSQQSALQMWHELLSGLEELGIDLGKFMPGDRLCPFYATDQDMLNIMATATNEQISTIGPSGMDFISGGNIMAHVVGVKPWRNRFTRSALRGHAPTSADKHFLANTEAPIKLYSQSQYVCMKLDMRVGSAFGRFIRRR